MAGPYGLGGISAGSLQSMYDHEREMLMRREVERQRYNPYGIDYAAMHDSIMAAPTVKGNPEKLKQTTPKIKKPDPLLLLTKF